MSPRSSSLSRRGVTCIMSRSAWATPSTDISRRTSLRARWVGLGARWAVAQAPDRVVAECRETITEMAPDLVHVHGSESFLGLALANTDVPAVLSLQGMMHAIWRVAPSGLGAVDLLRLMATRDFVRGYGLLHDVRRYRARARTELQVLSLCDAYLGRTAWDRAVLMSVRPDARYYQSEEVLHPAFYRAFWDDPGPDAPIFCTSGPSPFKGLETLLDALTVLCRTSTRPVRLRVAGAVRGGPLWPVIERRLDDPRIKSGGRTRWGCWIHRHWSARCARQASRMCTRLTPTTVPIRCARLCWSASLVRPHSSGAYPHSSGTGRPGCCSTTVSQ